MTSLKQRYETLVVDRQPFLDRAREAAELTIPAILPREGHTSSSDLYDPYQSVGARGVNTIASKLLLTLFPPNQTFFRLGLSADVEAEVAALDDNARTELEAALATKELEAQQAFEESNPRPRLFEALKHLPVTGNALLERLDEGRLKFYALDKFVVSRDYSGKVIEIILMEMVKFAALDDDIKALLDDNRKDEDDVEVYTGIKWEDGKYVKYQEVCHGIEVPDSEVTYKPDQVPFVAIRWFAVDGENYGRGLCEEHIGDLKSLEALSKALVDGASAAAKLLYFIDPNSGIRSQDLMNKPNGGFVVGDRRAVSTLQQEKFADFQFVERVAANIERRLEQAFLLVSGIQRNAERVTAEEIRLMANELESTLGGVYSLLSEELQMPLVNLTIGANLPSLPSGSLKPVVVAGIDGLGRSSDVERIRSFIADAINLVGQEEAIRRLDSAAILTQLQAGHGVSGFNLVRSPEEVQAEQQQMAMQQAAAAAAPAMAEAVAAGQQPQG